MTTNIKPCHPHASDCEADLVENRSTKLLVNQKLWLCPNVHLPWNRFNIFMGK